MSDKIKDLEGNGLEVGDIVTVIGDIDHDSIINTLDTLKVGEVVGFDNGNVEIQTEDDQEVCSYTKISKIRPEETIDEMIIRIANNLEVIQLMQESDLLDSMLQENTEVK